MSETCPQGFEHDRPLMDLSLPHPHYTPVPGTMEHPMCSQLADVIGNHALGFHDETVVADACGELTRLHIREQHCRGNHDECNCDCNGKAYDFARLTRERDALLSAAKDVLTDYESGFTPDCGGAEYCGDDHSPDWHAGYVEAIRDWQNSAMREPLEAALALVEDGAE